MDSLFVFLAVFSFLTVCTILFFIQKPKLRRYKEIVEKVKDADAYYEQKQVEADGLKEELSKIQNDIDAEKADLLIDAKKIESKTAELADKEAALETLRLDIQKKYNDNIEHRRKLQEYQANIQRKEQEIQENEQAFRKIEHNALVAINRWERKEWEYLRELQDSVDKLSMYSSIARRRNGFLFESYVADMLKKTDLPMWKSPRQAETSAGTFSPSKTA